jgi:hypothetical protein
MTTSTIKAAWAGGSMAEQKSDDYHGESDD